MTEPQAESGDDVPATPGARDISANTTFLVIQEDFERLDIAHSALKAGEDIPSQAVSLNALAPAPEQTASERTGFMTLPAEIRNEIYALALFHHEKAGFIAALTRPRPRSWSIIRKSAWTIVNGKEVCVHFQGNDQDDDTDAANGFGHVTQRTNAAVPSQQSHTVVQGHLCSRRCLAQPALTRTSSQVRAESLPYFYSLNAFHLETAAFYPGASKFEYGHGTEVLSPNPAIQNPRTWWRAVGDSNLRHITYLRIVDRDQPDALSPVADLRIDRTGAQSAAELAEANRWLHIDTQGLGFRMVHLAESRSVPEVKEALEQMRSDGPFVRGIEQALLGQRVLGIAESEVDWPTIASRECITGFVKLSEGDGLGESWAYWPGGQDEEA